ncbi:hypothetical protein CRUP_012171 [Coryphaenoides rupestris]|nr:hypothetical protein CRUP_012171 [Coryphaenoides rupestris]
MHRVYIFRNSGLAVTTLFGLRSARRENAENAARLRRRPPGMCLTDNHGPETERVPVRPPRQTLPAPPPPPPPPPPTPTTAIVTADTHPTMPRLPS